MCLCYPARLKESTKVRGYMKPASAFHTLVQWEELALELLKLQGFGIDSRGGEPSCKQAQYCNVEDFDRFVVEAI